MKVAITGHRPPKGGLNYDLNNESSLKLKEKVKELFKSFDNIEIVYDGMALGFDQLVCDVCIEINIPFTACIPCKNQDKMWIQKSKNHYSFLLKEAFEIVLVTDGDYEGWMMDKRNRYMVDQLKNTEDVLVSFHDGSKGGTYNCVEYAKKKNIKIINLYEN